MKANEPVEPVIEGRKRAVLGFDKPGKILELANGQRYVFERLNPPGQPPGEPSGDIFGWQLLEAVKLQPCQGDWKWNDEEKLLSKWVDAEFCNAGNRHKNSPEYFKRAVAKAKLNALPPAAQVQVRGVAWFEHDDGAGGWNTPVLLKGFREIASVPRLQTRPAEPIHPPEITDALLWRVWQGVHDHLDVKCRSTPTASQVFVGYCRDRLTLAGMSRRNRQWSKSTIKLRIRSLKPYLKKNFNLTLKSFFVDPAIFRAAEKQLRDYRAKKISPLSAAGLYSEDEND